MEGGEEIWKDGGPTPALASCDGNREEHLPSQSLTSPLALTGLVHSSTLPSSLTLAACALRTIEKSDRRQRTCVKGRFLVSTVCACDYIE